MLWSLEKFGASYFLPVLLNLLNFKSFHHFLSFGDLPTDCPELGGSKKLKKSLPLLVSRTEVIHRKQDSLEREVVDSIAGTRKD